MEPLGSACKHKNNNELYFWKDVWAATHFVSESGIFIA